MTRNGLVELGSVAEFVNGAAFKPSDWEDSGAPIIRIQNLTDPTKPFNRTNRSVSERIRALPGDLLVSWSATLGVFEWAGPEEAVVNQHIFRVIPKAERVDKRYLRYVLAAALTDMQRHLHGATMKHVNRAEFLGTAIPLPPLREQRRIADILDHADALRTKRRAASARLDGLVDSSFVAAFGPDGQYRTRCEVHSLGELCTAVTDGVHKTPTYRASGVPFVTVTNIVSGELDLAETKFISREDHAAFTKRTKPQRGDVLVSKDGTIGVPCLVRTDEEFSIFVSVALVKPKRAVVDPAFLAAQFSTSEIQRQIRAGSKGIAIRHLHLEDFKRLRFTVPPFDLQQRFGKFVAAVGSHRTIQRSSLAQLDALFASLQDRAFRGEL